MSRYILSDIAEEISVRENNPSSCSYDKFVGLEHYESGEIEIHKYGSTKNLASAMKVFQTGDILIARRNVYLRRASVVRFDGLTSGDSIVLRAKKPIFTSILPFIFNTKTFWNYADRYADGTMSKRLSPKILLKYEINLPAEEKLNQLAKILWAAEETKQAYKKLLQKTDDMVKAKFEEMFGKLGEDKFGWGLNTLSNYCLLNPRKDELDQDMECSFVPMSSVDEHGHIDCSIVRKIKDTNKGFTPFRENDVLFAKITPCMENGKGGIALNLKNGIGFGSTEFHVLRPIKNISNPYWLYTITTFPQFRINARKNMRGAGGQLRVPPTYLSEYVISCPPIELQDKFATFFKQTETSKQTLQKTLDSLISMMNALINQSFN